MTRQSRAHVLALLGHEPVAEHRLGAFALAQGPRPVLGRRRQTPGVVRAQPPLYRRRAALPHEDEGGKPGRDFPQQSPTCLARNVYFEARGEPIAGQYAVAEVTMNRRASRRFANTVCEAVYAKKCD